MKIASGKKWIVTVLVMLMVCVCAHASAAIYRLGDEADEIATIQTALKQLKLYTGEVTGHFGSKTEEAVKKFQKKYDLNNDGIVGEQTLTALYNAADISASNDVYASDSSALRYGSRSESVRQMQQNLKDLGYYSGTVSGHYGTLTEAAVTNFQKNNGLSADGIAGSKTLSKIASALGSSSSSSGSSSSSSSSSLLKYGVKSDAVRQMQQNLKDLGFYSGSITGNFGNLTKQAVYEFQRANGLSADGVAGSKTLAKIESKLSGSSSSSSSSGSSSSGSSSSGSSSISTAATLQLGSKNDEVLKLQKALEKLGYYTGNKTGNYGEKTAEAVKAFQKAHGLTADGIAGKKTIAAINAKNSAPDYSNATNDEVAGNVRYENFYNWRRRYSNGEYCTVYDYKTGYSWTLRVMSKDAHMDAEPATAEDTAIMNKAFGKTTWTPKVVWVTFSDGRTYIGSTHNVPHDTYHLTNNNFDGHVCVHFPISMEKAKEIGPYATSHQEAINDGWTETQKLKY